jgi:hypothetical protein
MSILMFAHNGHSHSSVLCLCRVGYGYGCVGCTDHLMAQPAQFRHASQALDRPICRRVPPDKTLDMIAATR